ncbi:decarboxylase [archaeon]|nr:decarboxylase [archaeon]
MKPKFILDKEIALKQYKTVEDIADIVSYSSKTNPLITKILENNTSSMFSIHFKNELKHIKDKSRVIFLAQAWTQQDIKELIEQNISFFVVDNESDLDTLLTYLETNPKKITLLLRLKLKERTLKTEKYFVFGMDSKTINKRMQEIDGITLGIHFHRKTQNMAEWSLKYEIENLIEKETLNKISYINIGGGLPSEYANTNVKVINSIIKKIQEFKSFLKQYNLKLIIEPGRFISAPAIKLQTQIIGIDNNNIVVNTSVYNTDMDALIVPVKLLVEGEGQGNPYVIKGITPCSLDLFRYKVYLQNPKIGDTITFLNAGAYNFTTNFCDLDEIETEIK